MDNSKIKILGIAGSLREKSFNKAALEIAKESASENIDIEIFEGLADIPLFNQDNERHPPKIVTEFKDQICLADAILIATPEYNYSIPGVLKNAIDWASRPYGDSAWEGKPVGILSASGAMLGGARAQYQLRQVFIFLNMHPLNRPEVIIPHVAEKVDEQGKITDPHTKEKIAELVDALVKWTVELRLGELGLEELDENDEYQAAYGRITQ